MRPVWSNRYVPQASSRQGAGRSKSWRLRRFENEQHAREPASACRQQYVPARLSVRSGGPPLEGAAARIEMAADPRPGRGYVTKVTVTVVGVLADAKTRESMNSMDWASTTAKRVKARA